MEKKLGVHRAVRAALAAVTGMSVGGMAVAQDDVAVQQKITVTGSRIKRVDIEGPLPVTVIDREDIERSGDLNVSDVLRRTTYNTFGSFRQRSGDSRQSVNAVDLRGLGPEKTLVLVDGRRLAGAPTEQGTVQNLTMIPLAAVERIEVLRDGASAIYGTDAIAGVINIITRKDYEGIHLSWDAGRPTQNGGDEDAYSITGGVSGAKGNITFAFDAQQRDLVYNADRSFSAEGISSFGFPGSYFAYLTTDDPRNPLDEFLSVGVFADPRCPASLDTDPTYPDSVLQSFPGGQGICRYNYTTVSATEATNDTKSFFINGNYEITERTSFYAQGTFSHNDSFGRFAPAPIIGLSWFQNDPNNPTDPANPTNAAGQPYGGQSVPVDLDGDGSADLEVEGPFDLSVRYRNVPTGPRDGNFEDVLLDYVAGVQGSVDWLGGADWQLGAFWSKQTTKEHSQGFILAQALNNVIRTGNLDVYGVQDTSFANIQQQADGISLTIVSDTAFRITGGNGQLNFDAFQLNNGPVPVALGFEYRDEDFDEQIDDQTKAGAVQGAIGQVVPVTAGRSVMSLFGETAIPVLDTVEVDLAVRYDHYNDFGTTINPKASIAFRPLDVLLLRASYGRGFQAPDMRDLYTAPESSLGFGIGGSGLVDTWRCSQTPEDTDGDGRADVIPEDGLPLGHPCNGDSITNVVTLISGGNRDLDPTKSEQWNLGFVWNPLEDLSIGLDYYRIDIDDEVGTLNAQQKLDEEFFLRENGTTGDEVGDVVRINGGRVAYVTSLKTNIAKKKTQGMDLDISYSFSMGRFGDLHTTAYWTHVLEFEQTDVTNPDVTEHLDGAIFYPKDRAQVTLAWAMGDYTATVVGNYIGHQSGPSNFCSLEEAQAGDCYFSSWTTWDVQVAWATPWNGQITVGARNVFDRDPPHRDEYYDNYQHDVFGRVPYVRWEQDL